MRDNKPNLFLVGAAKAGTTSIYHYLKQHPDVYLSPIKEPNFFGNDIQWENFRDEYKKRTYLDFDKYFEKAILEEKHNAFLDTEENYLKLFREVDGAKVRVDCSTSYLYSSKAAQEIYEFNPEAKIIIILRNPVDRTFSHYFMDVSNEMQSNSNILDTLKEDYETEYKGYGISNLYIDMSLYSAQIARYQKVFPRNQLMIVFYEDLVADKQSFMKRIFQFADLNVTNIPINLSQKYNLTGIPKNRAIKLLLRYRNYFPQRMMKYIVINKGIFLRPGSKSIIPEDAKKYIDSIICNDWEMTKYLINKNVL